MTLLVLPELLHYNILMSGHASLVRLPESAKRIDADVHAPHDHSAGDHGHDHAHSHVHSHAQTHSHAHDHDHDTAGVTRAAYVPAFSLFALSAGQRLLLALPVIAALWLAACWAMGMFG